MARTDPSTEALRDLRRARRRNRLTGVHWIDALYRAYLTALGSAILLLFASSRLPDDALTNAEALDLARDAPAVLGAVFAVAVAIGLRSGGRGGPLVLEAPVVVHELGAPVRRFDVLRGPAFKQLRFLAFAGAIVGTIVGEVAARRVPVNVAASIAACAAAFALAGVLASGAAMALSGRRASWLVANVLAGLVLTWSAIDLVAGTTTSPLTLLGQLATWPIEVRPLAAIGVAVALTVPVLGVASIAGISVEAALRRAGLVSQLRFAVTLQDVRTVVLLRRQLSQERPRARPWWRLRRGGRLPAAWRRDWQGILRFPAVRLGRLALLGAVAGVSLGAVWRGLIPMVAVAGLALYLAAYDAVEPVAQEVDHPTRWGSYPIEPGRLLLEHVPAAVLLMVVVCTIAGLAALTLVPPTVVGQLGPVLLLPVAATSSFAAAIGTAQGSADSGSMIGLGPEVLGLVMLARLVIPPALVVGSLLPLLLAGFDVDTLRVATVSNTVSYTLFALIGAYFWLRSRKPKHL